MTPLTNSSRFRFSIANMLATTTIFAILTPFMWIYWFYPVNVYFIGMIVAVITFQHLLFRGAWPRLASISAGFLYTLLFTLYLFIDYQVRFGRRYDWDAFGWDAFNFTVLALLGGLIGYVANLVINGVFLISRKLQRSTLDEAPATE